MVYVKNKQAEQRLYNKVPRTNKNLTKLQDKDQYMKVNYILTYQQ